MHAVPVDRQKVTDNKRSLSGIWLPLSAIQEYLQVVTMTFQCPWTVDDLSSHWKRQYGSSLIINQSVIISKKATTLVVLPTMFENDKKLRLAQANLHAFGTFTTSTTLLRNITHSSNKCYMKKHFCDFMYAFDCSCRPLSPANNTVQMRC